MEAWSTPKKKKSSSRRKTQPTEIKSIKSELFYNLAPTIYISKICGILPVKFYSNDDTKLYNERLDPTQLVYGFALAIALSTLQCCGLIRDIRDGWQKSTRLFNKTAVSVTGSDVFFVICVTAFAILGSPSRWQNLRQALDKILQADEKLKDAIAPARNVRKFSIILIACTYFYLWNISTLDYVSWGILVDAKVAKVNDSTMYANKGPINYSPMYLMYTVIVSLQMQYAIVLSCLGVRFDKLNSSIESITKTNAVIDYFRKDMGLAAQEPRLHISRSLMSLGHHQERQRRYNQLVSSDSNEVSTHDGNNSNTTSEMIDQLIIVHDILCDSIIHMNKAFGSTLLLCTLSCLIHLVITFYFLYAEFNSANSRWYVFIRQIGWIIFHIYKMMLFVQPPFMVASKARDTGSLVSQALAYDWNLQEQKQLERFALQILHRPVEFEACGLFYLDRGLMTSIAGAVTTYLVILVQFQNDDDKETRELLQNASDLLNNVPGAKKL